MKRNFILLSLFVLSSCNNSPKNTELSVKNNERVNENLMYFNQQLVEDIDIENEKESKLYEINDLKVKYVEDIIYVKGILNANGCDDFIGNVEFSNEMLNLKMKNISDEPCMSNSKFEVRFIIMNKMEKQYKINFEIK